jgi:hypothetical protein
MTLLEQIQNDRYGSEHVEPYAKGWNAASKHIEALVKIHVGLAEIREAEPLDLRVRAAMTGVEP